MNENQFRINFEELSKNLVLPLAELVSGNADEIDKIFIWGIYQNPINQETRSFSTNYFLEINEEVVQYNHEDFFKNNKTYSEEEEDEATSKVLHTFEKIIRFFEANDRDAPSEIKAIYSPKTDRVEFKLEYEERRLEYLDDDHDYSLIPWVNRVRNSPKENRWIF